MNFSWLKPNLTKAIFFLLAMVIPFLREHVQLPEGGYVVARYSVGQLIISYLWLMDWWPLFLMALFAIFIYILVAVFVEIFTKYNKRFLKKYS